MTPDARVQTAIEILDAIDGSATPADRLFKGWFRRRRYAGGGDRRAVADHVWGILRRRAALDWWVAKAGRPAPDEQTGGESALDGRSRMIAALALDGADLDAMFSGAQYGPQPLSEVEASLATALAGQNLAHEAQPTWVRGNCPHWVEALLAPVFGADLGAELAAMNAPGPVDLRVNTLKADRDRARAALAAEGIEATPTPLSTLGLRLAGRTVLPNLAAYRDGLVEIQDEASQLAAAMVDARPGQAVLDLCAGAGGKTLAIAAAMENTGRIVVCDADPARMKPMAARLARAGVTIVQTGKPKASETFDRVLVDAPCTGSGAWRRNPEARWRLAEDDIADWAAIQRGLLDQAAARVRPGGRLVYVTCSVFAEENDVIADDFLARHAGFAARPAQPYLHLTPGRHGTDGFFVAVFERAS